MLKGLVVEEGTAKEVMEKPTHPHTMVLLAFVSAFEPRLKAKRELFSVSFQKECVSKAECPFAGRYPWGTEGLHEGVPRGSQSLQ